jgi:hypothetical protein
MVLQAIQGEASLWTAGTQRFKTRTLCVARVRRENLTATTITGLFRKTVLHNDLDFGDLFSPCSNEPDWRLTTATSDMASQRQIDRSPHVAERPVVSHTEN